MNTPAAPLLFDAHNDSIILREVREDPMDFAVCVPGYHVDLPRLRQGRVGGMFVMCGDLNLAQSGRLIDATVQMACKHPDDFQFCRSRNEVKNAMERSRIALVISIEGQAMFGENTALLRQWHRLGVRVASLTHGEGKFGGPSTALQYDHSCGGYLTPAAREQLRQQEKGLTPFARESLQEMARLNMVLDLTHANDAAFWEALELYNGPVCCTHSNCFSHCPHARNLTDSMMTALAERDGVLALCLFAPFIDPTTPTLSRFADHLEHALTKMGKNNVAIGSDFDGIPPGTQLALPDAAAISQLWQELDQRGFPPELQQKLAHRNLLRLLPE